MNSKPYKINWESKIYIENRSTKKKGNDLKKTVSCLFYFLCISVVLVALYGCNRSSKRIGDVTLLWNEIPGATSYNVYMSKSPGVSKISGHKITNAANPLRINLLEPGKTYYFVVTVVDKSGESKESKELSYTVSEKIGLVYWKNLFEQTGREPASTIVAENIPKVKAPSEAISAAHENDVVEKEARRKKNNGADKTSISVAQKDVPSTQASADLTAAIERTPTRKSNPGNVAIETGTNPNLPASGQVPLVIAQTLADSNIHIFFNPNSNELSPEAIEKLDRIHRILSDNADVTLTLNGYSDSVGDPSFNRVVSEVRASTVKSYLVGKGIAPSRISAVGHGARNYLTSNESEEGRRLNRRVEIEFIMP